MFTDFAKRAEEEAAARHGAGRQGESAAVPGRPDLYRLEERCAREFAASPALRDEFRTLETYTAFRRAEAKGLVKILGKRREA